MMAMTNKILLSAILVLSLVGYAYAGTFNASASPTLSTAPVVDALDLNAGSPVSGTWYSVANFTGAGIMNTITLEAVTTTSTAEIRITVDSGTPETLTGTSELKPYTANTVSPFFYVIPCNIQFQESLLVEARRNGDTNQLIATVFYNTLSKEVARQIIQPGQPLPNYDRKTTRPNPYEESVMVRWYKGDHGYSNRVVQKKPDSLKVWKTIDGNIAGRYIKFDFNQNLNQPIFSPSVNTDFSGVVFYNFVGKRWEILVENGVVNALEIKEAAKTVTLDDLFLEKANQ